MNEIDHLIINKYILYVKVWSKSQVIFSTKLFKVLEYIIVEKTRNITKISESATKATENAVCFKNQSNSL